jgi:hypothetical protein
MDGNPWPQSAKVSEMGSWRPMPAKKQPNKQPGFIPCGNIWLPAGEAGGCREYEDMSTCRAQQTTVVGQISKQEIGIVQPSGIDVRTARENLK